ncbi:3-dehydrosphinganine reductase [Marasmius crinis-equi]|uniref:3-dehydrosphinganine reductase n=1 Tax=Marasmius crinis-equi TaxID=585013 RepID=A0ABR3F573_9AGAR
MINISTPFTPTVIALFLTSILVVFVAMWPFSKKWNPRGQHCYVTGGSAGLGLALAVLLAKHGAHVSIVARDREKLRKALEEVEKARQTSAQIFKSYSYSLSDSQAAEDALKAASEPHGGKAPDAVFLCAGTAHLGYFVEQTPETLQRGMESSYWVAAYTALAYTKRVVQEKKRGKLTFVSSVLGYMSIVGYSSYSPAKHAMRGLAETLRSELLLYGTSVHICFPTTIYSPGYEEENKTKPAVTLKIEETDEGQTPEQVAQALFKGVQNGHFHIGTNLLGDIFRSSTRGVTPRNNLILDSVYALIGSIGLPIWRWTVDSTVKGHREEHNRYLREKGLTN